MVLVAASFRGDRPPGVPRAHLVKIRIGKLGGGGRRPRCRVFCLTGTAEQPEECAASGLPKSQLVTDPEQAENMFFNILL
jgi:hypothetical protein